MVLVADLFSKCFSLYARIFCAVLNNLARVIYVINANGTLYISLVPIKLKVSKLISVKSTVFEFGK